MAQKNLTISQKKDWAKLLMTKEGYTQAAAAEKVKVSRQAMNRWYKDGKWDILAQNIFLTSEEQMVNMVQELAQINESIKLKPEGQRYADSKLGDVRRKLVKDIKDLETEASLHEIIHASAKLLEFIRKVDLQVAQDMAGYVDSFIKSKL